MIFYRVGAVLFAGWLFLGAGISPMFMGATARGKSAKVIESRLWYPTVATVSQDTCQPVPTWYTAEEQEMMGWIIQQEVRGGSLEHKRAVAEVILNRVKSPRFPDTIREVLLAPGQFTSVQNWYNRTYPPDEDTLQAVEDALSGNLKPVTGGAVFFYAPRWTDGATAAWFESLPLTLEMEGHRFFGLNS